MVNIYTLSVDVHAIQWTGDLNKLIELQPFETPISLDFSKDVMSSSLVLYTGKGRETVCKGDWLIKNVNGELSSLCDKSFTQNYKLKNTSNDVELELLRILANAIHKHKLENFSQLSWNYVADAYETWRVFKQTKNNEEIS